MSDKDNKNKDNRVIHFPDLKKRKAQEEKEAKKKNKDNKDLKRKEDIWRVQYRIEQAAKKAVHQGRNVPKDSGGKQPFINWDKIPPFTRISVGLLITVQLLLYFFIDAGQKLEIIYTLGFTPGVYTGMAEWSAYALISPFSSLIIHEGWTHLGFNLVMLVIMGIFFEQQFGARRTAIFFILSGMCGHALYIMLSPYSVIPVIGASGAISGLFAAAFIIMQESGRMGPEAQKRGPVPFILIWSTLLILLGLMSQATAWQSHLGGFWGGALILHLWRKGTIRF